MAWHFANQGEYVAEHAPFTKTEKIAVTDLPTLSIL